MIGRASGKWDAIAICDRHHKFYRAFERDSVALRNKYGPHAVGGSEDGADRFDLLSRGRRFQGRPAGGFSSRLIVTANQQRFCYSDRWPAEEQTQVRRNPEAARVCETMTVYED